MDPLGLTLAAVVGLAIGALGGFLLAQSRERARRELDNAAAKDDASSILQRARDEAENLRRSGELQGKEEAMRLRDAWDQEESKRREEAERLERRLVERAESLDSKFDALNERELAQERRSQEAERGEADLLKRSSEIDRLVEEGRRRLEGLAGMTAQDARKKLIEDLQDEARAVAANAVREIKDEAQRTGDREAKKIIALAIQRMAAEQTAVTTVSVVQLPSDEMKGRIIGREGRNIRSFEQASGIDVIIDDTPEAVVLSGFDPVRREVARIALERLIEDGRIHPGRIEEVVQKAGKEVDKSMVEAAEEVLYELGIHNVHPEIVKVLGRLRFRSSYGQNHFSFTMPRR